MTPDSTGHTDASAFATVLVAEDDGPSGQFFREALKGFGYRVDLRSDGQAALALARERRFDLLLLDCRMPGAGAVRILSALREDTEAASHATPALATSAELETSQQHQLRQMGFADAIAKPVTLALLKSTVQSLLAPSDPGTPETMLDDASALKNSGAPDAVHALRGLFILELHRLANELGLLADQPTELAERLHRLLASCGFCGATALASASRRLKRQVDDGTPPAPTELERFRDTLMQTVQALDEHA